MSDLFLSRFRNVESFILSFLMVSVPLLLVCPNFSVLASSAPKRGEGGRELTFAEILFKYVQEAYVFSQGLLSGALQASTTIKWQV